VKYFTKVSGTEEVSTNSREQKDKKKNLLSFLKKHKPSPRARSPPPSNKESYPSRRKSIDLQEKGHTYQAVVRNTKKKILNQLAKGVDIDAEDKSGCRPLLLAVKSPAEGARVG
tara:strand:- start:313 stop:654 length:342 start_codon:yes stop_codon:yes gene_type:complete